MVYSARGRVILACSTARSNVWTPIRLRLSRATPTYAQTFVVPATTTSVRPGRCRRQSRGIQASSVGLEEVTINNNNNNTAVLASALVVSVIAALPVKVTATESADAFNTCLQTVQDKMYQGCLSELVCWQSY